MERPLYHASEIRKPYDVYFLDTPVGLAPTWLNTEEKEHVKAIYDEWNVIHHAYVLTMKNGGRNLTLESLTNKKDELS